MHLKSFRKVLGFRTSTIGVLTGKIKSVLVYRYGKEKGLVMGGWRKLEGLFHPLDKKLAFFPFKGKNLLKHFVISAKELPTNSRGS